MMEQTRRKVAAANQAVVAELEARNVPGRRVAPGWRQFVDIMLKRSDV